MGSRLTELDTLDRPIYGIAQAADLLDLKPDQVRRWLDGYERRGKHYPPVIREAQTGDDLVTWGEFVELGFLREYRRAGVSLQALRPIIADLREEYGAKYPLARKPLYVAGRNTVVRKLQDEHNLPRPLWIVMGSGQLAAAPERFFKRVEFDPNENISALHAEGSSLVRIDPERAFGMPSVRGVRTERLYELWCVEGEDTDWLADVYELSREQVEAAVEFEQQRSA